MKNKRLLLSAVVVVVLLAGCYDDDDGSSGSGIITGDWTGTWTDSLGGTGCLEISFDEGFIGVKMRSGACGSAEFDYLTSQHSAFASGGNVDFLVANCDCTVTGCVFAGGIFRFNGTYGSRYMQGTYEPTSPYCGCCSYIGNRAGSWEVAR